MTRTLTESEIDEMKAERIRVGADGRNAIVCECGHIDYRPNTAAVRDCIVQASRCVECRD